MLIIRKKSNPNHIARLGYVVATEQNPYPLGAYDSEGWEQVELPVLPDGYELVSDKPKSGKEIYQEIAEIIKAQPVELRIQYAETRSIIGHLLDADDLEAAQALIEGLNIDPTLKQTILSKFN